MYLVTYKHDKRCPDKMMDTLGLDLYVIKTAN